jgi:hypothetical protein
VKSSQTFLVVVLTAALAFGVAYVVFAPRPESKDSLALVERVREVARLETLDVQLYKKVSFEPQPEASDNLWKDLYAWAAHSLRRPHGRAILFAEAHLGYDFNQIGPQSLNVRGNKVEVALPALQINIELKPGETEIIGSNLDSAETAQLFEVAKQSFREQVMQDKRLHDRARSSAERALKGLFFSLGYREVVIRDAGSVAEKTN